MSHNSRRDFFSTFRRLGQRHLRPEGGTANEFRRKRSMSEAQVSSYGSWKSPITSDLIVSGTIGLGQVAIDGADVYWVETRPQEKGRYVVSNSRRMVKMVASRLLR